MRPKFCATLKIRHTDHNKVFTESNGVVVESNFHKSRCGVYDLENHPAFLELRQCVRTLLTLVATPEGRISMVERILAEHPEQVSDIISIALRSTPNTFVPTSKAGADIVQNTATENASINLTTCANDYLIDPNTGLEFRADDFMIDPQRLTDLDLAMLFAEPIATM